MPRRFLRAAILLLGPLAGLAASGGAAGAQDDDDRTLHWRSLALEARLDAEGRLHVAERHAMVFDGVWNGGERRFDLRIGQDLEVERVTRTDPVTGATEVLQQGDLDEVGHWDRDGSTLRWRSRAEDDPPFRNQELVYTLHYTLSNVVVPTGDGGFRLAHDFAFEDRTGEIERFSVVLTLDPAWRAPAGFTGRAEAAGLAPGRGWVMTVPLRHVGGGSPPTMEMGPGMPLRAAIAAGLILLPALLLAGFFRRERAAGRFEPLPTHEAVDERWLREEVLRHPPELVGAIWDRSTGAPEVAAFLARLVQEGKLASRVEPGKKPVLHLTLLALRSSFRGAERELIDKLFWDGRSETSTAEIKEHYKKKGFDPAAIIAPEVEERLDAAMPGRGKAGKAWGFPLALLIAGVATIVVAAARDRGQIGAAVFVPLAVFALGSLSLAAAGVYAKRAVRLAAPAVWLMVLTALLLLPLALFALGLLETGADGELGPLGFYHPTATLLVGVLTMAVGWAAFVLEVARPSDLPERLAFRRRLAVAREYFEAELERPDPRLKDEWYPYLLAFGLGPAIDRWFDSFAAAGGGGSGGMVAASVAARASGTGAGGGSGGWTGGGASFGGGSGGGGGAGGAWSVAAASMAAGVAAPSSGGATSGGGGGGGW